MNFILLRQNALLEKHNITTRYMRKRLLLLLGTSYKNNFYRSNK